MAGIRRARSERLIGAIRRECLDHMIVFGEAHLRRILGKYAAYYNGSRIHRSLNKDALFSRAIERLGVITSRPVLGGLHHQYCRIRFSVHTGILGSMHDLTGIGLLVQGAIGQELHEAPEIEPIGRQSMQHDRLAVGASR